jgi:hypothetical protein
LRQDAPEIEAASVGGLFQLKNMSRVPSWESVTNDNRDPANKGLDFVSRGPLTRTPEGKHSTPVCRNVRNASRVSLCHQANL